MKHALRGMGVGRRFVRVAAMGGLGLAVLVVAGCSLRSANGQYVRDPAALVNPLIGTTNRTNNGNGGADTFPGADVPFGMVQWSPDTSPLGINLTSARPGGGGYNYADSTLVGYTLNHLSGCPNCLAEGALPILPTVGSVGFEPTSATEPLSHALEHASAGYYALTAGGVETQLTVTPHTGMAEFTFPHTAQANVLLKLSGQKNNFGDTFQVVNDREVAGSVTRPASGSPSFTLHFVIEFNRPFSSFGYWDSSLRLPRQTASSHMAAQPQHTGLGGAYVTFNTEGNQVVLAKIGVSYVSVANAGLNLRTENSGWNFAGVERSAQRAWNDMLDKIQVGGGTREQQVVFYTALYHSLLHPNVFSDVNGQYIGFNGQVETAPRGQVEYANYSGWDIYRTTIPLQAMLAPQQTDGIVNTMLQDYANTGQLPKWSTDHIERYVMVGDPADAIIANAYAFGARGFNAAQALTDMEAEATKPNQIRPGLNYYLSLGYLPINGTYGCCDFYGPVSTQEEYNVADYAIAELAQALGHSKTASLFATRANNWQNVFNPEVGYVAPKLLNGAFQPNFNPLSDTPYVEQNAYIYTLALPFDVQGLIAAKGGSGPLLSFLESMTSNVTSMGRTSIQMSNEPSFNIPWEFDYVGAPYQTQQVVRNIQTSLFTDQPGGMPGEDDLGAMSAWYVWSALGLYPETAGSGALVLGSPMFPRILIHLGNGHTIRESAPAAASNAPFVHGLTLNGTAVNTAYLLPSFALQGGTLDWTLSPLPDYSWAASANAAPPSDTQGLLPALGYLTEQDANNTVTVSPGSSTTVALGVHSMSTSTQSVDWTASASAGLTLGQSTGTITVDSEANATQTVPLSVPSGTAPGSYLVTFQLQAGSGAQLPNVVLAVQVQ